MMRKFRFVGDPEYYSKWDKPPVVNMVFDEKTHAEYYGSGAEYGWESLKANSEWEEVFEEPAILHKDTDLGYFAVLAMGGLLAGNRSKTESAENLAYNSIIIAKELIKQLDEQNK